MFNKKSVLGARNSALTVGSDSIASASYGLEIDGDGHPDILWHNPVENRAVLWHLEGADSSQQRDFLPVDSMASDWLLENAVDFNGDGHQDLLWRNETTGQNEVWFMGGQDGIERQGTDTLMSIGSDWEAVGAADFDRDGQGDLLWRNQATGQNEVWFMDGDQGTDVRAKETLRSVGSDWKIRGVADFDRDGHADILWRNNTEGRNALWLMDGTRGTVRKGEESLKSVGGDWEMHGAADFDRDGTPDILWRDAISGKNAIWYMTGAKGSQKKSDAVLPYVQGRDWFPIVSGWQSSDKSVPADLSADLPSVPTVVPAVLQPPEPSVSLTDDEDDGFNIQFDYRFDTSNWFDDSKKAVLEAAADIWENIIQDEFENIEAGTTVHASNPNGDGFAPFELKTEIDDLRVFAYATEFAGSQLAEAGATTYQGDRNTETVFQPWLGEIEFNTLTPWFFDANPSDTLEIPTAQADFLSVAVHELGHILGISSSISAFKALINDRQEFVGEATAAINGGSPIPLDARGSHIEDNFEVPGLGENALDPKLAMGTRKLLTILDVALLDDIGYDVDYSSLKPIPELTVLPVQQEGKAVTKLQAGDRYQVRWDDNFSEKVKIELYEGNKYSRTLAAATDSDGRYDWTVPEALAGDSLYYRIKVSSVDDSDIYSLSDRPFSIQSKPELSANRINGDSPVKVGAEYELTWRDNLRETVKIELYKDGEYSRTLTASTLSDGSYRWRIPGYTRAGSGYQLRFTSTADSSIYDYSATFSIEA